MNIVSVIAAIILPLIGLAAGYFGGPYIDAAMDVLAELLEPWWHNDDR